MKATRTAREGAAGQAAATAPPRKADRSLELAHGRRLELREDGALLLLAAEGGQVELKVRVTEEGPTLVFDQARLALQGEGDLDLRCGHLSVKARRGVRLESGGDMLQRVAGDYRVEARDDARLAAQAVSLEAELGALDLKANDDLALSGLRVLLNVPSEEEMAARVDGIESFKQFLARPFVAPGGPKPMEKSAPVPRPGWESGDSGEGA